MQDDMIATRNLDRRGSPIKEASYPTQLKPRFHKNRLLIGYDWRTGREIWFPTKEAFRCLLLGSTRAGKSFISERILSVAFKGGNGVAILTDIKNEFHTLSEPLQQKFVKNLAPEESPMSLPIKVYRPWFLVRNDKEDYGNIPAQLSLGECELSDLVTLLAIEKDESKRGMLAYVMEGIKSGHIMDIKDVPKYVDSLEEFTGAQKKSFLIKFAPLMNNEVLGDDHPFSFAKDIAEGFVPVFNMEGFEAFGREYSSFPQAYVAIELRKIIRAKTAGKITEKVYIFVDELARFVPKFSETTSKIEILEAIDTVGAKGINFVFAAQDTSRIPPEILKQSRFVFIPYNAGRDLIETVLREKGILRWSPIAMNAILDSFKEMKKFSWLMIDSNTPKEVIEGAPIDNLDQMISYAPLGKHEETKQG